ncbi:winged helix-turn-helix domain-containing protein [Zhongshania sp. BJYM1]|uniref:winged helix-turn-helix domain-containing protein n=1 Tax=Zhongshania aquatica TaxID=2965069 RepID=UPI0022B466E2|nr:crosslink repair DNA glycosylase YcaQ family protein [Marortus sp. BJYM1]
MTFQLSEQEARKLVLHSQRLPATKQSGSAQEATLAAIEHLGYVQIDTISAIQRAHHHTLWNRNPRYKAEQLDQLVADKKVFEYWSHAAAYLPMRDYRHSLPRKHAIANGDQRHWYAPEPKLMKEVLKRIREEGPLKAKDFEHTGKKRQDWSAKPAKRALESLYMQGELMIASRVNFHKVYDLTERVLPVNINTSTPTPDEHARFLIKRYLQANGLGQANEIGYLLKNTKPLITSMLREMISSGELEQVEVAGNTYYALSNSMKLINKPLPRDRLTILSPFDNLLIQRKRTKALFDFDYLIECYVPESKRQYGYFSLPLLCNGNLVARMDCKADRQKSHLYIHHLALETSLNNTDKFFNLLCQRLPAFLKFNGCATVSLHKTQPQIYAEKFQVELVNIAL